MKGLWGTCIDVLGLRGGPWKSGRMRALGPPRPRGEREVARLAAVPGGHRCAHIPRREPKSAAGWTRKLDVEATPGPGVHGGGGERGNGAVSSRSPAVGARAKAWPPSGRRLRGAGFCALRGAAPSARALCRRGRDPGQRERESHARAQPTRGGAGRGKASSCISAPPPLGHRGVQSSRGPERPGSARWLGGVGRGWALPSGARRPPPARKVSGCGRRRWWRWLLAPGTSPVRARAPSSAVQPCPAGPCGPCSRRSP